MVETAHRKENEYLYVGARVTAKACHAIARIWEI